MAAFALHCVSSIPAKGELDYGEGVVLWQAAHVTDWPSAYHRIDQPPYLVFHYPPVYHLVSRAMALATGNLLKAGRLVSVLSLTLACGAMAALMAVCFRRRTARVVAGLMAATFIFTLSTWPWAYTMRVDTIGLFFEIAGVALFVLSRRRPALAFAAFALFVAAVFSKQSLMAAPTACLVVAFLERPRRALHLGAFALALGAAVIGLLQYLTRGGFLVNVVGYNVNHFSINRLAFFAVNHFGDAKGGMAAPLILAGIGAVIIFGHRMPGGFGPRARIARMRAVASRSLFGRCLVTAFLFFCFAAASTLAVGKIGSNINYFFEMDVALTLLCALVAGAIARRVELSSARPYRLATLVLYPLLALHSLHSVNNLQASKLSRAGANNRATELAEMLKKVDGPVYSEAMLASQQNGKELIAEPAIITALARAGAWDETPFVRDLEEGRFAGVVITTSVDDQERFSPRVRSAIERRYAVAATSRSGVVLMVPSLRPIESDQRAKSSRPPATRSRQRSLRTAMPAATAHTRLRSPEGRTTGRS